MKQNKILLMLLAALLMPLAVAAQTTSFDAKYVLVVSGDDVASENAASSWFTSTYGSQGRVLTVSQLSSYTLNPSKQKAVWVHLDQGLSVAADLSAFTGDYSARATNLEEYVKAGGSVFLSLHAGALISTIGRVASTYAPNKYDYHPSADVKGIRFKGFDSKDNTGHAIFANMTAVDYEYPLINESSQSFHEYLWDLNATYTDGQGNTMNRYQTDTNSTILGTWTHVDNDDVAGLIEFNATDTYKGTIIVMGEGCYAWDSNDKYGTNIQTFTQNVMGYLKDKTNDVVPPSGTAINEKYVMVVSDNYASIPAENNAVTWFTGKYSANGKVITASEVEDYSLDPKKNKAVWVHFNQATTVSSDGVAVLKGYMQNGGNLLLTKHASDLLADMDRIGSAYKANLSKYDDNVNKLGGLNVNINSGTANADYNHSSHPAFAGLLSGGAATFDLVANGLQEGIVMEHGWDFNNIAGKQDTPNGVIDYEAKTNSIVLGTWKGYTNTDLGFMIEYLPQSDYGSRTAFQGRAIAIGAGCYAWNASDLSTTGTAVNIQTLTDNCLTYLESCTNRQLRKETYVAYLLPQDLADGFDKAAALAAVDQDDEKVALEWFYDELVTTGKGKVICPKDLADLDPSYITTTWVHIDRDGIDRGQLARWTMEGKTIGEHYVEPNGNALGQVNMRALLARYVENGGNLLLTKHAVQLVNSNGFHRTDFNTNTEEYGDGTKTDTDIWAINAVVGAGAYGTDYYYQASGFTASRDDHRKNHLYYNMEVNNTFYPDKDAGQRYEVYVIIGAGTKEDHNCIWKEGGLNVYDFQTANHCTVLGQWGHMHGNTDNAVIVDFEPCTENTTANSWRLGRTWEGHILCIGLGAYEWQQNKQDGSGSEIAEENPYLPDIKQLTYNALNVLENPISDETVEFTVDGVTYLGISSVVDGDHATIIDAVSTLETYDLTDGSSNPVNGQVTNPATGGKTYTITSIGLGAFMKCTDLAYADIMAFGATITSNPRAGSFPEHTLIYLPASCDVTGQNLVNTQNGTKTCEDLKVFDKKYWANKYAFTTRKMSYTRDYSGYEDGLVKTTVALPFPIDADHAATLGTFYEYRGVSNGIARFAPVSSTTAYLPYMFKPVADAIAFESATDVTIPRFVDDYKAATSSTVGGEFIAGYRTFEFSPANNYQDGGNTYVIYSYKPGEAPNYNRLLTTSGKITNHPFRVYLRTPKAANSARMLLMTFDDSEDQPTEIDGITTQPVLGTQPAYDLSGRRVQLGADLSRLTRGIYIIGGRKVVIK